VRRREMSASSRQTQVATAHPGLDNFVNALRDEGRYASAYDRLVSSLELIARSRRGGRILVTSARPREGKSTVVVNLALAMSFAGRRVLVIDADLRCPTLHQLLERPNHRGLADVLSGQCDVGEVLQAVTFRPGTSPTGSVTAITSGTVSPDSAHLLGLPRMAATLENLSGSFDFIVLDSPPVLPVNDPIVLATAADMVLLVIQAGEAAADEVQRARQRLESVNATIVGSVLTRFDSAREEDGHYEYPYRPD
jgi:capsular exopolysaccharide synthesis family protein